MTTELNDTVAKLARGKYDRKPARCPHCNRTFAADRIPYHVPRCTHNPELAPIQRAALDDGTGHIRCTSDYKRNSRGGISADTLMAAFSTWAGVAGFYGLAVFVPPKPDKRTEPKRKRNVVPTGKLKADERVSGIDGEKLQALDYHSPHVQYGPCDLPVCRTIDAGHEVRYVLR